MNVNRKYAAITAVITLVMLGVGVFLFSSDGSTAPETPSSAQTITAEVRDTSGAALSGVAVQLTGPNNAEVTSGTTAAGGQVSLTFDPTPGSYVLTATEPTGYRARDDKDGAATDNSGLTCASVYLCVYLTATEMQNTDGSTFMRVQLTHVRADQVSELDDLWFELTPPSTIVEEETSEVDPTVVGPTVVGPTEDDEILIGETGANEPLDDSVDDALDDVIIDDPVDDAVFLAPIGLVELCVTAVHQPVVDQNTASGIWVRGEVYGLDGGWIWVEGPTINNGDPLQIPIGGGLFESPLGINSFGDHTLDRFELQGPGANDAPVDLLPTLQGGPGATFPVGPDEGSIFDDECYSFDPPVADASTIVDESADATIAEPTPEEALAEATQLATARVDAFLAGFVADHVSMNSQNLLDTLHPAIPLAFGDDRCNSYVADTTGSITGATIIDVDAPQSIDMDTPNGTITFPEAIPFTVEFDLMNGARTVSEATLVEHEGESRWLTRCGFDG